MKRFIGILAAILIIGGIVMILVNNKAKMKEETSATILLGQDVIVSTIIIEEELFNRDFSSNGATVALNELNFVSDASGRVVEIYVKEGTKVKAGTPLLRVDTELLQAEYDAALTAYNAMKKDEERFARSNAAGGVTAQQLDNIRTQLVAAESRLARSRKMLNDATLKSPLSGTVNMKYVELGSLIAPNVPLFDIVDDSQLKVVCNVSETKVKLLSVGQKVTATSSTTPDAVYTGKINHIGIKTDRGLNYPVEVILDKNSELKIGMYLKVNFSEGVDHSGILVPRKAIVGSAKAANVYVVESGKAVMKEVSLGDMKGDKVEILSGLNSGEELIVAGIMNVADGKSVIVSNN